MLHILVRITTGESRQQELKLLLHTVCSDLHIHTKLRPYMCDVSVYASAIATVHDGTDILQPPGSLPQPRTLPEPLRQLSTLASGLPSCLGSGV